MMRFRGLFALVVAFCSFATFACLALAVLNGDISEAQKQLTSFQSTRLQLEARLLALQADEVALAEPTDAWFWKASNISSLDATLQNDILKRLAKSNLAPQAFSQINMAPVQDNQRRAVSLEFEGSYESVLEFLSELEAATPPYGVSQLRIRPRPIYPDEDLVTPVGVRLIAWAFWKSETEQAQ